MGLLFLYASCSTTNVSKPLFFPVDFKNFKVCFFIRLKEILKDLSKNKKITILVSSHDIQDVTEVCERIVLLEKGKVIKDIVTSPKTLKELESYFKGELL